MRHFSCHAVIGLAAACGWVFTGCAGHGGAAGEPSGTTGEPSAEVDVATDPSTIAHESASDIDADADAEVEVEVEVETEVEADPMSEAASSDAGQIVELTDAAGSETGDEAGEIAADQSDTAVQSVELAGAVDQTHEETEDAAEEVVVVVIAPDEPSLRGLDRSHWPAVSVAVADGRTPHWPHYFSDAVAPTLPPKSDADKPLDRPLTAALEGADAAGWSGANLTDMWFQPIGFGLDAVLVAPRQLVQPVWQQTTTP